MAGEPSNSHTAADTAAKTEFSDDVLTVRMEVGEGWEKWFLLMADVHWDNPHCDRPMLQRHLKQAQRAVWLPDPTFVVQGHNPFLMDMTLPRLRLGSTGRPYQDEQVHIQLPTYKDEFALSGGYHFENGRPPKPLGAVWLRFFWDVHRRGRVGYELTRAK